MGTRLPASMRTLEALSALIEGRLASPAGRSELVELATRLIAKEALQGAVRDALDRGYYERGVHLTQQRDPHGPSSRFEAATSATRGRDASIQ